MHTRTEHILTNTHKLLEHVSHADNFPEPIWDFHDPIKSKYLSRIAFSKWNKWHSNIGFFFV